MFRCGINDSGAVLGDALAQDDVVASVFRHRRIAGGRRHRQRGRARLGLAEKHHPGAFAAVVPPTRRRRRPLWRGHGREDLAREEARGGALRHVPACRRVARRGQQRRTEVSRSVDMRVSSPRAPSLTWQAAAR
eukprot:9471937-Pyramimonas_sp.AAC.1